MRRRRYLQGFRVLKEGPEHLISGLANLSDGVLVLLNADHKGIACLYVGFGDRIGDAYREVHRNLRPKREAPDSAGGGPE